MELVYLWVEDYKNIKRQGFNFSPKFKCKYDDESKQLTIDENEDYLENFFGDNINVTAIVGENGSGKSSLLKLLGSRSELKNINSFLVYKKEEEYYCEFKDIKPEIFFDHVVNYIDRNSIFNENAFYPKVIRIAHEEKIGEYQLSHYYFGKYSGIYGGMNVDRHNDYNMLEARFFVPRYINIATDYIELFNRLNEMYKFDTLRLLLRSNSTSYITQWINKQKQIVTFSSKKVCIYEKNEQVLNDIQKELRYPIKEIEIHLHNKNREKVVSVLKNIESMHRQQRIAGQIENKEKYQEFDLAILIAFTEYYLKNTDPCDPSNVVYEALLELKDHIDDNALKTKDITRIVKSYILDFFQKLKDEEIKFIKDDPLNIDKIIEAIKYIQPFNTGKFYEDGSPYFDISIDTGLKENLEHIKILQKIFFEYEFDCGKEEYLRVFEYDLINNKIGSSYETISDGEKHFIRFAIDIVYHLRTIKEHDTILGKGNVVLYLADEPDNAMHPIWKQKLINHVMEIFKNYSETPNIKQHFIFTTHSPFLLSDIPKENVIFLDKVDDITREKYPVLNIDGLERGNCINVSKYIKINPFGANIHTLLSHGFFMKDGLMGEFAKEKINSIIENLNDKNFQTNDEEKKQLLLTINSIGEEFLKSKLLDMYYKKFNDELTKKLRKEELLKQQEKIATELSKYD